MQIQNVIELVSFALSLSFSFPVPGPVVRNENLKQAMGQWENSWFENVAGMIK